MVVLIRCDVGPTLGVGHVMRCLALAEEFLARGHEVVMAADVDSVPFAQAQVAARGLRVLTPPAEIDDVAGHLQLIADVAPAVVVIDSYLLTPEVYAAVRAAGRRDDFHTLALVDGPLEGRDADVFLDQNIGADELAPPLPPQAVRLAGLDYCLLRNDVLARRPADPSSHVENDPPRVLAFFGGTDAYGAAPPVLAALAATGEAFEATVVAASEDVRQELARLPLRADQRLEVIEPTDHIAELAAAADLVISAAGSSVWELLAMGVAVAFVCVADNQVAAYELIRARGVSATLGGLAEIREDPSGAVEALRTLLRDGAARERFRCSGWSLVDGAGRMRVVDALLSADGV